MKRKVKRKLKGRGQLEKVRFSNGRDASKEYELIKSN